MAVSILSRLLVLADPGLGVVKEILGQHPLRLDLLDPRLIARRFVGIVLRGRLMDRVVRIGRRRVRVRHPLQTIQRVGAAAAVKLEAIVGPHPRASILCSRFERLSYTNASSRL